MIAHPPTEASVMRVRRGAILSAAFLALAVSTATAQPPVDDPPLNPPFPNPRSNFNTGPNVPAEQVRNALLRLNGQAGDFPKDLSPFAEAVKKRVLEQNPNIDPKLLENAIRKVVNDPERMKQLRAIAEKQAATGGKTPAANDIAKMFEKMPQDVPGVPDNIGKQLGKQFAQGIPTPVDSNRSIPQFPANPGTGTAPLRPPPPTADPGRTPTEPRKIEQPKSDPSISRPKPPDPGPVDPARPPQKNNVTPPNTPPNVPDAQPQQPAADPSKPPNPFEQTSEDQARGKAIRALGGAWERNVGPLNETPSVQRALTELVTGVSDLKDSDGNSLWDKFDKELGGRDGFGEWLKNASFGGDWKMPSLNMPSFNWGRPNIDVGGGSSSSGRRSSWWNRGSSPRGGAGGGSGGGFGIPGLEGTWLPVVLLAAVLLGALVWWRFVYLRDPTRLQAEFAGAGVGPWPLDPRRIDSREDVVRAFEYLSVLICGPEAKTWTHATIAEALTNLARTHGEAAVMLARLYELARYAPLNEPLTPDELSEARRLVCALAGVANA